MGAKNGKTKWQTEQVGVVGGRVRDLSFWVFCSAAALGDLHYLESKATQQLVVA